jgi:hypothetical protein
MRKLGTLTLLTAVVSAMGLMAAFAASASADSITCNINGSIKLSPGLSENPTVQNIAVTKHKGALLSGCTGSETTVTGGSVHIIGKTTEAVTCAALKGPGAPVALTAIFKWQPNGSGNSTSTTFSMPLTEMSVALGGTIETETPETGPIPFSGDTISGTVTQKYNGTCGSSGHGKGGGKKVNKGSLTGTITVS